VSHVLKTKWFPIACITTWGLAIYANTFRVPFVFDDLIYIQNNPIVTNPCNLREIVGFAPSRWIAFFSFALNYHFGQENTLGYHFINLAIHIGSAISCYGLVLLTFRTPRLADQAGPDIKSTLALLGGLIFLSHPVQTEAVTYIWQRVESLASFSYLLSIVLYVKSRLEEEVGQQSYLVSPSVYYIASCVLAFMSAMTKEIVVTLPATIILYEILFFGEVSTRFKRVMLRATPFLCLLIVVPVLAIQSPVVTKNLLYESPSTSSYMLTQTRVIATYLRLLVWPVEQNIDYDFPLLGSILAPEVLGSTLLIFSSVALAILVRKTWPLITFGTIWFFITLSPTSSIIPLPDVMFEHRLYLPLVGFVFVLIGIITAFKRHWKPLSMGTTILLLLLSAGTYSRNNVWQTGLTLWKDAVQKSPDKARPHVNLATWHIRNGEHDRAVIALLRAISLKPDYAVAYENLGVAYFHEEAYEPAIAAFEQAIDLDPSQASTYNSLAETYMRMEKKDLAIKNFDKALRLNPAHLSARNNLGLLLAEKGHYLRATAEFEKVLKLDPNHKEAAFNLARAYTLSGQMDRAVKQYQTVIRLEPSLPEAYHNLGILYLESLNRPQEAKRYFEQALILTKDPHKAALIKEIISQIETSRHAGGNPHGTAPATE
jgi:tetratricopeptide (TPR) repeat protein